MSILKSDVLRMIEALPDDCALEQIQYHLDVLRKIVVGIAASDEGRMISQEEMERRIGGRPNDLRTSGLNAR